MEAAFEGLLALETGNIAVDGLKLGIDGTAHREADAARLRDSLPKRIGALRLEFMVTSEDESMHADEGRVSFGDFKPCVPSPEAERAKGSKIQ